MRRSFDSYRRATLQVCDNGEFLFSQAPTGDTAFRFAVFTGWSKTGFSGFFRISALSGALSL